MFQQDRSNGKAAPEPLVISKTDDGFRVYSPADPTKSYMVTGSAEQPACTCLDFQHHTGNPNWRCKHIQAVLAQLELPIEDEPGSYEAEERRAIQDEGRQAEALPAPTTPEGVVPQMVIKRSVSPDGRIDSLSVEFSCPVGEIPSGEIKARAQKTLQLQTEIVNAFLGSNGNGNGHGNGHDNGNGGGNGNMAAANGAMPAQMLNVAGVNTKWGRRLLINIQANGQTLKFFGSRKQLAEALTAIGFPNYADQLQEGLNLNLPCRVITKPSEDGRYLNIEQVLPPEIQQPQRRFGR